MLERLNTKISCHNTDDVHMKTVHVPILVETDEDGVFIVSCPPSSKAVTHSVKPLMRLLPVSRK
jgi:hypothetical protein